MSLIGKFIIVDVNEKEFHRDENGKVIFIDSFEEACLTCGMYEFEDALVCEVKFNHIEK